MVKQEVNHSGMIYATLHPRVDGNVLELSLVTQLSEPLGFWRNLDAFDYRDVFEELRKLEYLIRVL